MNENTCATRGEEFIGCMRQLGVYMGVSRLGFLRETTLKKPCVDIYGSDRPASFLDAGGFISISLFDPQPLQPVTQAAKGHAEHAGGGGFVEARLLQGFEDCGTLRLIEVIL